LPELLAELEPQKAAVGEPRDLQIVRFLDVSHRVHVAVHGIVVDGESFVVDNRVDALAERLEQPVNGVDDHVDVLLVPHTHAGVVHEHGVGVGVVGQAVVDVDVEHALAKAHRLRSEDCAVHERWITYVRTE
jgi:hypothetical protein